MAPPSASPSPLPTTTASRPPPSSAVDSKILNLILRCFSLILVLVSLVIMATNSSTNLFVSFGIYYESKTKFDDVYAYRYMLATAVIGMLYMLLQIAFAIYHITMGKRLSHVLHLFDFYGDKVISYLLATGAATTFGATIDAQRLDNTSDDEKFLNKANAAASILLIAFVCAAISSIFSSLAVSKKH